MSVNAKSAEDFVFDDFCLFEIQILRTSAPAVRMSENCLQLAPQDE